MRYRLKFTNEADRQLSLLECSSDKIAACKAVYKCLGLMEVNLRHPSLHTHQYSSLTGPNSEKIFESYAQNQTPGAYRIFWYYGPSKEVITVVSIIQHPDNK